MTRLPVFIVIFILAACNTAPNTEPGQNGAKPYIAVLGIAQDAGYPQAGCEKECCKRYYTGKEKKHFVSCIALVSPADSLYWLFDCTPDLPLQLHLVDSITHLGPSHLAGIFL